MEPYAAGSDIFPTASSFSLGGSSSALGTAPQPAIGPSSVETTDSAASTATAYTIAVGQTAQGTIAALLAHASTCR